MCKCSAHLVVTSASFNGKANPHDRNIQHVLNFAVQLSNTFIAQKSFSELGSDCGAETSAGLQ